MLSRRQAVTLISATIAGLATVSLPVSANTAVETAQGVVRNFTNMDHSGLRLSQDTAYLMQRYVIKESHTGWDRFFITGDYQIIESKPQGDGIQVSVKYDLLALADGRSVSKPSVSDIQSHQVVVFNLTADGKKITEINHAPYVSIYSAEALFDELKMYDVVAKVKALEP